MTDAFPLLDKEDHDAIAVLWRQMVDRAFRDVKLTPESRLWHYTSVAGALGLIQGQRIWAGNMLFMNDPNELRRVYDRLTKLVGELQDTNPHDPTWNRLRPLVESGPAFIKEGRPSLLFVSSYTLNGDSPPHWHQYCERGRGVAVGFDAMWLVRTALDAKSPILPCIYDEERLTEFCRDALDLAYRRSTAAMKRYKGAQLKEFDQQFAANIELTFGRLAPRFKGTEFTYEDEWRGSTLVFSDQWPTVKHRIVDNTIRPYIEMDYTNKTFDFPRVLPIRDIRFGPVAPEEMLKQGFRSALQSAGYPDKAVEFSSSETKLRF
jgi:hypothetical protein